MPWLETSSLGRKALNSSKGSPSELGKPFLRFVRRTLAWNGLQALWLSCCCLFFCVNRVGSARQCAFCNSY